MTTQWAWVIVVAIFATVVLLIAAGVALWESLAHRRELKAKQGSLPGRVQVLETRADHFRDYYARTESINAVARRIGALETVVADTQRVDLAKARAKR